jgi:cation transport ATPase
MNQRPELVTMGSSRIVGGAGYVDIVVTPRNIFGSSLRWPTKASWRSFPSAFVLIEGHVSGPFALSEITRPESKTATMQLRKIGLRCMILTGDSGEVARWVGEQLRLDEYFAEAPLGGEGGQVKMVGI